MKFEAEGVTDTGLKRAHNEDCFGVYPEIGLYVVADGMGGHAAGEVASRIAVDTLRDYIAKTAGNGSRDLPLGGEEGLGSAASRLVSGIKLANREIYERALKNSGKKGMGTTVVAALADGGDLCIAHVGDSRAYRIGQNEFQRITADHSYVEEMVLSGQLSPEMARSHPLRNIITRALGTKESVDVDVSRHTPAKDEVYLLCSDGLNGMLSDAEIAQAVIGGRKDLPGCAAELIRRANERGGDDNITVLLIKAA